MYVCGWYSEPVRVVGHGEVAEIFPLRSAK
jgi:hypothetical protein